MDEYMIGYITAGTLLGLVLGSVFYMAGGRASKWLRRFIGSLIIASSVNGAFLFMGNWSWWFIAIYPLLILGFCMGYGANTLADKVWRRSLYAATNVLAGILCAIIIGGSAWSILVAHCGVAAFTIYLGVRNPIQAASEETFICVLLNLGLCMYPFVA